MNENTARLSKKSDVSLYPNRQGVEVALVAGVAGFVGSRIAEVLVDAGIHVLGLDSLVSGKEQYLERLIGKENFELIETDVQGAIPDAVLRAKPRYVIHALDVYPHIGKVELGLNELLNNSLGLKHLLEIANQVKARVIFTSSVDIYQGLASNEQLQNYYNSRELTTYYEYLEGKRYGEALCREYLDKFGVDVRVARMAEVYGPRMDVKASSTIARALRFALEGKELVFDEEGSRQHQLIFVDDAAYGVLKLLLSEDEKATGGIFYFVNPEMVSTLSIGYTIRQLVKKDLKVEFLPQHQKVGFPAPVKIDITRTMRLLKWHPQTDLTEGLEKTVNYIRSTKDRPPVSVPMVTIKPQIENDLTADEKVVTTDLDQPQKPEVKKGWLAHSMTKLIDNQKGRKINIRRYLPEVGLAFAILLGFLVTPLLVAGLFIWQGGRSLNANAFVGAADSYYRAAAILRYYQQPAQVLGLGEEHAAAMTGLQVAEYGGRGLAEITEVGNALAPVFQTLTDSISGGVNTPGYSQAELYTMSVTAIGHLRGGRTWLALAAQGLDSLDEEVVPEGFREQLNLGKAYLYAAQPLIDNGQEVVNTLPMLLGFERSQHYLVMLQNPNELRPTGGFMGSYINLQISEGRVTKFKIDDIYNPDGQLTPHTDPVVDPTLANLLGLTYLPIRDANWWIDFSKSGETIARLYERATGEMVDYVVGVNVSLAEDLLRMTGPVELAEVNEIVTADNLAERVQVHAEVGFAPGSTGKRDFLAYLADDLFGKIGELNTTDLGNAFAKELLAKEIMFYAKDEKITRAFSRSGLAGNLRLAENADYLSVIDSNVAVNKVNYWIDRQTSYAIDVDREGGLTARLNINFTNRADSSTWPAGEYKNYLRVYAPLGVVGVQALAGITDLQVYEEFDRTVIAGLVIVAIGQTKEVKLSYNLPATLALGQAKEYRLVWEPQPGIKSESIDFSLNLPVFLTTDQPTNYQTKLTTPTEFKLPISGTEAISGVPTTTN